MTNAQQAARSALLELAAQAGIVLTPAQFSGVLETQTDEYALEDFAKLIVAREKLQAELTAGVEVASYSVGVVTVDRVKGHLGPDCWAVRFGGQVLNKHGVWETEPLPGSRNAAFFERCRFDTAQEAIHAARGGSSPDKGL